MKFTLRFDTIRCGCDTWRQRSVPCPDCGEQPQPWEVDATAQKRAAAITWLRNDLDGVPPWERHFDPAELTTGGLGDILFPALKAADRFARNGDTGPLRDALRDVAALEAWAEGFEPLRPDLAVGRAAKTAALATTEAVAEVLDALATSTMADAFDAERAMNASLGVASEAIATAKEISEVWAYVERSGDPMTAWLRPLLEQPGPLDVALLHAAEHAEAVLAAVGIHIEGGCPPDLAATVAAVDGAVSVVGDLDSFWAAVASHWQRLIARPDRLADVLSDRAFADAVAATGHDGWARLRELLNAEAPETLRQAATAILRHGHAAIEGPVHHLYTAARATAKGDYQQLARQDAGDNLKKAADQGWYVPPVLLDKAVRNAYAHIDFEVSDDDLIVLSPRGRQEHAPSVTLDQLIDQVVEIEEVANALLVAFQLAATSTGLDLPDVLRDIPAARLTEHMLHAFGWDEAHVKVLDDIAEVVAARSTLARLSHVMAAVTFLPPRVERARFDLAGPDGRTATVETPLDGLRQWPDQPDSVQHMFFLGILTQVVLDGRPVMPVEGATQAFAMAAGQLVTDKSLDPTHKTRSLRSLAGVARTFGLDDAAAKVKKMQSFHTAAVTGLPLPESALDGVFVPSDWDVSQLDESLFGERADSPDPSPRKSRPGSNRSKRKRPRRRRNG